MKPPPLLLGLALVFWGWRVNLPTWGLLMGTLVEGARLVRTRWDFSLKDLSRIWDLSCVLVVGEAAMLISSQDRGQISFKFFQWLPIPLYLMLLAQLYGTMDRLPLRVFSWLARRSPNSALANKQLDISWFYFVLCLVGASATPWESIYFFPAMALLVVLALMAVRPRRLSLKAWLLLVIVVGATGFGTARVMLYAQNSLEASLVRWIFSHFRRDYDFRESHTSIGNIGRLKLSGRIVLRLKPDTGLFAPDLLQQSIFNYYYNGVWRSAAQDFKELPIDSHEIAALKREGKVRFGLRISGYLNAGRGILAIPHGTFELRDIQAVLTTNRLGVVKLEEGPGLLEYRARYTPNLGGDAPPTTIEDLDVPDNERAVLQQIVEDLKLQGKSDQEKIQAIAKFFTDSFTYSTYLRPVLRDDQKKTALGQFLLQTRSGHCEYFATATTLLLRQAGIPARYVTGFSVQERSGGTYIVRERHAHAWVLVYRQRYDRWEEFDTTPGSWSDTENSRASSMEPVSDFFSRIWFAISQWRYSKTSYVAYARWLLAPLILFLAWRIVRSRRRKQALRNESSMREDVRRGKDSEFYLLEQRLAAADLGRLPNEFPRQWVRRRDLPQPARLEKIIELHHRLRFDPRSLTLEERQTLKAEVEQWLAEFELKTELQRKERAN